MVRKRHSEMHLFYFFDLQSCFQITRVQSKKKSSNCGTKFVYFRPSKCRGYR